MLGFSLELVLGVDFTVSPDAPPEAVEALLAGESEALTEAIVDRAEREVEAKAAELFSGDATEGALTLAQLLIDAEANAVACQEDIESRIKGGSDLRNDFEISECAFW